MSDRIVVMRNGLIEQVGTPGEIYNLPRNAFVADFVGSANLIRGRHRADLDGSGLIAIETQAGHIVHGTAHGRAIGAELYAVGAHRAPAALARAPGRGAECLAGAGRALRISGRLHPGPRGLGATRSWSFVAAAMDPLDDGAEAHMTGRTAPGRVAGDVVAVDFSRTPSLLSPHTTQSHQTYRHAIHKAEMADVASLSRTSRDDRAPTIRTHKIPSAKSEPTSASPDLTDISGSARAVRRKSAA